jgi:hypothetical protein
MFRATHGPCRRRLAKRRVCQHIARGAVRAVTRGARFPWTSPGAKSRALGFIIDGRPACGSIEFRGRSLLRATGLLLAFICSSCGHLLNPLPKDDLCMRFAGFFLRDSRTTGMVWVADLHDPDRMNQCTAPGNPVRLGWSSDGRGLDGTMRIADGRRTGGPAADRRQPGCM